MPPSNFSKPRRNRKVNPARQMREVDHKNIEVLKRYITEFGQIESRKQVGNTPITQRAVTQAIKRARHLALLPFVKQ
jgi:small subunit ribosomal protein S18